MLSCHLKPTAEGFDGHFRADGRTLRIALRPDPKHERRRYRVSADNMVIGYAEPLAGDAMMMVKACLPFWPGMRQSLDVLTYRRGDEYACEVGGCRE